MNCENFYNIEDSSYTGTYTKNDGVNITYFPHLYKVVHKVCNYEQGLLHGRFVEYHPDGSIDYECNYTHGLLHGIHKTYKRNKVYKIAIYNQNVKVSETINFLHDGSFPIVSEIFTE